MSTRILACTFLGLSLPMAACNQEDTVWEPFNAANERIVVEVLPAGSPIGEPVELELLSSLGRTLVGIATVDPGSGPVGTSHLVTVDVLDEFELLVGRVTLEVQTGAVDDLDGDGEPDDRGEGEFEMRRDSADPGAWAITMESLGADDEERQDVFTFHLWQPEELAADPETE